VTQWGLVSPRGAARAIEVPITIDRSEWPRLWRTERWRHFYFGRRNSMSGFVDFESELAYLRRRDLLMPDERAVLEDDDDEDAPNPPDLDDPEWGWLTRRELTAGDETSTNDRDGA
jgi:hypothetical protein